MLTVASCVPGIHSALSATHDRMPLPPMSQTFPYGVYEHDVVVCGLESPLFDAQYVAYDAVDPSEEATAARLARLLDGSKCYVGARRIEPNYYRIGEVC